MTLQRFASTLRALASILVIGACTSDESPSPGAACQPGQSAQCTCGASVGSIACMPNASWGLCQCAAPALAEAGVPSANAPGGSSTTPSAVGATSSPQSGTGTQSTMGTQPSGMDAGSGASTGSDALPCEVSALLSTRCGQCHGAQTQSGAPMSLVTWSDLQKPAPRTAGRVTRELVLDRIKSSQSPMPPAPFPHLSAAEIDVYQRWLSQGAKASTSACQGGAMTTPSAEAGVGLGANLAKPADCEASFELKAHGTTGETDTSKFKISSTPALEGNQYHCFYFKPPYAAGSGMLWFDSILDNKARLHHWILYATDNATHAPGTSAPCNAAEPGAYFVAGWAPGATNAAVPPDASLALPSGANAGLILEVHYYNDSGKEQLDGSGLQFCTAKQSARPHVAGIHTLGSEGICVKPGARAHEVVGRCTPRSDRGDIHITGVWPHMHKLARRQRVVIKRKDGTTQVIHDEPFDFNAQIFYPKGDIVVKAGDTVETHCYYDNDTSQQVHFGERTQDEMCYAFVAAWPAGALTPAGGPSGQGVNRCADDLSILGSCNGISDRPVTVDHPP